MKDAVLIELAHCWDIEAKGGASEVDYDDSPTGLASRARDDSRRETLRECADTIRSLVSILGDKAS